MKCPSSNHIIALCHGVTFFKPYFIFHCSLGVLNFPRKAAKKKPKEEQVDKDLLQILTWCWCLFCDVTGFAFIVIFLYSLQYVVGVIRQGEELLIVQRPDEG